MKARHLLLALATLVALLVIAGTYYYRNLPAIVESRAIEELQDYGVQTVRYDGLRISHNLLRVQGLRLLGRQGDWEFSIRAKEARLAYDWRELPLGKAESLEVDDLSAELRTLAPPDENQVDAALDLGDFSAETLKDALPFEELQVGNWRLAYSPFEGEAVSAEGSLQLADQLELRASAGLWQRALALELVTTAVKGLPALTVSVADGEIEVLEARVRLASANTAGLAWSGDIRLDHGALLDWLPLTPLDQEGAGMLPAELVLSGSSQLALELSHAARLDLPDLSLHALLAVFEGSLSGRHSVPALMLPGLAEGLSAEFTSTASLGAEKISVQVLPQSLQGLVDAGAMGLPAELADWLRWQGPLEFNWSEPVALHAVLESDGKVMMTTEGARLKLGNRESEWRVSDLGISLGMPSAEAGELRLELDARVDAKLRRKVVPQLKVEASHSGSLAYGESSLRVGDTAESMLLDVTRPAGEPDAPADISLFIDSADLAYASSSVLPLLNSWELLDIDLSLLKGSARLDSTLRLVDGGIVNRGARLTLVGLEGVYDREYAFAGLSLTGEWEGLGEWRTLEPFDLRVQVFNPGFDVLDTRAQLSLPESTPIESPRVRLDAFTSTMFGGRVFLPEPQTWDFSARTNTVILKAADWQLADMVAMQAGQDIQAAGVLEGELPVTVEDGRFIVENGYLRALPPGGTIRYVADEATRALADSSSELKLAMDLLSHFEYELLSSRVELDKEGNLLMGLSLAGRNPNKYKGKAVNFNINVEQNVDPLLKSLRLSDKLVRQLEKRAQ